MFFFSPIRFWSFSKTGFARCPPWPWLFRQGPESSPNHTQACTTARRAAAAARPPPPPAGVLCRSRWPIGRPQAAGHISGAAQPRASRPAPAPPRGRAPDAADARGRVLLPRRAAGQRAGAGRRGQACAGQSARSCSSWQADVEHRSWACSVSTAPPSAHAGWSGEAGGWGRVCLRRRWQQLCSATRKRPDAGAVRAVWRASARIRRRSAGRSPRADVALAHSSGGSQPRARPWCLWPPGRQPSVSAQFPGAVSG